MFRRLVGNFWRFVDLWFETKTSVWRRQVEREVQDLEADCFHTHEEAQTKVCECGALAYHTVDDEDLTAEPLHFYECFVCGRILNRHFDPNDEWHESQKGFSEDWQNIGIA